MLANRHVIGKTTVLGEHIISEVVVKRFYFIKINALRSLGAHLLDQLRSLSTTLTWRQSFSWTLWFRVKLRKQIFDFGFGLIHISTTRKHLFLNLPDSLRTQVKHTVCSHRHRRLIQWYTFHYLGSRERQLTRFQLGVNSYKDLSSRDELYLAWDR